MLLEVPLQAASMSSAPSSLGHLGHNSLQVLRMLRMQAALQSPDEALAPRLPQAP